MYRQERGIEMDCAMHSGYGIFLQRHPQRLLPVPSSKYTVVSKALKDLCDICVRVIRVAI